MILDNINSPQDLKALPIDKLPELAQEIRELIISTTAENGGHLAPNLGVVELTIALHYVFDTPTDKIIWDVGHQSYTHKILTGRKDKFATIRQEGGISGFCAKNESEYDCFTTGHSSNSISLAMGMAEARDQRGEDNKIIAVIGDGAISGGMALEALNHAGDIETPLLVILNDNEMSINHNVGALNSYLSHIRSHPKYSKAKNNVHHALDRIPWLGKHLANFISGFKNGIKSLLVPGMFFEYLGFTYLGPTDGHNIKELIEILRQAATIQRPVLLHTITVKGKGYEPAEQHPYNWHGVEPFDIATGMPKKNNLQLTYTSAFSESIMGLAEEDENIIAITAAMTDGTGLAGFKKKFPGRFYDVGIAEQHAVTFAAGLANAGKKPVVAIYSAFIQRAYDQIMEDVCLQKLPVIFAIDRAGIVGNDGYTHQGIYDISFLRTIPGLTIIAPADARELRMMLRFAVSTEQPVAIRYPKALDRELPVTISEIELGRATIIREGSDLCFFALGSMVSVALDAAALLAQKGISAQVVNARFAAPIDDLTLRNCAANCHGRIITVEENVQEGGFGVACQMILAHNGAQVVVAALPHTFIPQGCREHQLDMMGLSAERLVETACNHWFKE